MRGFDTLRFEKRKEKKMKKLFEEFKKFIKRGNVVDMAVGVAVAAAFTAIVTAFTKGFITPLLSGKWKSSFSGKFRGSNFFGDVSGMPEYFSNFPGKIQPFFTGVWIPSSFDLHFVSSTLCTNIKSVENFFVFSLHIFSSMLYF